MRPPSLLGLFCSVIACSTSTSATPLDTFTKKQSAVTTSSTASTRVVETSRTSPWTARAMSVRAREVCKKGSPSSLAVGTEGDGSVFFQSKNTRGSGVLSWDLNPVLRGREIGEVRFEVFDASPGTSPQRQPLSLTTFVKVEDRSGNRYTISTKTLLRSRTKSRTLFFRFKEELPQNLAASLTRPNRVTVGISHIDQCDALIGLRKVKFSESPSPSPLDLFRTKRSLATTKQKNQPADRSQIMAASPQGSPSPVASPTTKTCANENPSVLEKKKAECLDALPEKELLSLCKDVECECIDHPDKDYTVEPVASNFSPKGTQCVQLSGPCKGDEGLCNANGNCLPQGLVDLTPEDFGFINKPEEDPSEQCINTENDPSTLPEVNFLCSATIEQFKDLFKRWLKPAGTPCTGTDPDGTQFAGVCSFLYCVRPPPPTDDCNGKAQCTDCDPEGYASNGACWNGSCLKMGDFEALHCQGVSNSCLECQGIAVCNPDGRPSRKERVINEGGACAQSNGAPGICSRGKCSSSSTMTPAPQ